MASLSEKYDSSVIRDWIQPWIGHEHLMDIKEAPSIEKYLAIAPDIYVIASMLQSSLSELTEQRELAEMNIDGKEKIKPWNELTEEEKISEAPLRAQYLAGLQAGRDTAMIEIANRVVRVMRTQLDSYRLENTEYDPKLVVDEPSHGGLD